MESSQQDIEVEDGQSSQDHAEPEPIPDELQSLIESVHRREEAVAQALEDMPTYEELLELLEQGPENVPWPWREGPNLGQPPGLRCFCDPKWFQLDAVSRGPTQRKITEIVLRDVHTGSELHAYVEADIEWVAQRIESKIINVREILEKYRPYYAVMFAAYVYGNVRGDDFTHLLNYVARLYANHQGYSRYEEGHKKERSNFKKWCKRNLIKLAPWSDDPKTLPYFPQLPSFRVPDIPLVILPPFRLMEPSEQ